MKKITFYELNKSPLEDWLLKLLLKIKKNRWKCQITATEENITYIDKKLWEIDKEIFIPHKIVNNSAINAEKDDIENFPFILSKDIIDGKFDIYILLFPNEMFDISDSKESINLMKNYLGEKEYKRFIVAFLFDLPLKENIYNLYENLKPLKNTEVEYFKQNIAGEWAKI